MSNPQPIPVAVLGATGLVGQRLLRRLVRHPWFRLAEVSASDRSVGRQIGERVPRQVVDWVGAEAASLRLQPMEAGFVSPLILSALPSSAAREVEPRLVEAGHRVVSNASTFRADPAVPLIIPEINPDHLELLDPGAGGLVTNPNCAVAPLALALAPLHRAFGIRSVVATTFQAVSGAGRGGPTHLELSDNVLPVIPGEEEKVEREVQKLLGATAGAVVESAAFPLSATTTRVPVLHGHMVDLSVGFARPVDRGAAVEAMRAFDPGPALPSLPRPPLRLTEDPTRPQPRLDRDLGDGMAVTVGRVRACQVHDIRMMVLAHNLERGAAGAALANAELCAARGWIPGVEGLREGAA
jgi:aspartate-semialdehyde dehydrogenase